MRGKLPAVLDYPVKPDNDTSRAMTKKDFATVPILENKRRMLNKRFNRKIKAFTLCELLIAVGVLAIGLTAVLLGFITCFLLNESSRNLALASGHSQFVMEEITSTTFTNIKTKAGNGDWDWDGATIQANGLTVLSGESIDTQVTGTDPLTIAVTANWLDRGVRNRSTVLQTLLTQP